MRLINLSVRKILTFLIATIMTSLCTYQVIAKQQVDNKCYKVNTQSMVWLPGGLEIDSHENIYIGVPGHINVYDALGIFKYAIKVNTYGAFQMKITDNDMLNVALSREEKILVYDNEGYVIQEKDDKDGSVYGEYSKNYRKKKLFGNEYKLSNIFGNTKVVKISADGIKKTIYHIPLVFWLVKLLIFILFMIPVLFSVILITSQIRNYSSSV